MHHTAHLPALVTTPLARGTGQARWLPEARERRRLAATARRLTLAAMMVATFVLGSAIMVATAPTAVETGQPPAAPPGLDR